MHDDEKGSDDRHRSNGKKKNKIDNEDIRYVVPFCGLDELIARLRN